MSVGSDDAVRPKNITALVRSGKGNIEPMLRTKERLPARQLDTFRLPDHQIVRADTPELLEACYRLRYQVYCVENSYEDSAVNAGGLETDEYDSTALHALVVHRRLKIPLGTVRLILPSAVHEPPLPFLGLCKHPEIHESRWIPIEKTAEISRFAVSKASRISQNRKWNQEPGDQLGTDAVAERDALTVALIRAFVGLASENGIEVLCALMTRSLLRRVNRLGIQFEEVGPVVEHHGLRQPVVISMRTMLEHARVQNINVWNVISDEGAFTPHSSPFRV